MPADRLFHPRLGHSEKISGLSDIEFRVWVTYQLTSDDYGVMRMSSVTIQASDDSLSKRPAKAIDAALKRLIEVGLIGTFEHQGRVYAYQNEWQNFQRVKHPRDTMQPAPPDELLAKCSAETRKLFQSHPTKLPKDIGNISETDQKEKSESGSLACERGRETANGIRLTANGSEGGAGEITADIWARELINLCPPQGRCGWNLVERPLWDALTAICSEHHMVPGQAWEWLKDRLEKHKRSHQWRSGRVKRIDRWLIEGLYLQEPSESAPSDQRDKPAWAQKVKKPA